MDVRKEFEPKGSNKAVTFVSSIGFLKLENAFKECALEVDYLLPPCEQKEAALKFLLQAKKACTSPAPSVELTNNQPAQVQQNGESNVKESKQESHVQEVEQKVERYKNGKEKRRSIYAPKKART